MNINSLTADQPCFIDITEGVKYMVCDKESLRNDDKNINNLLLQQLDKEKYDISIRIINSEFDKCTHEYCDYVNGHISGLKVNFSTHVIILVVAPQKLPSWFKPVMIDPFNPDDADRIEFLLKKHRSCN